MIASEDHPRSRGVYAILTLAILLCSRIIPARAGFTWGAPWGEGPGPDHPRSRGVYRDGLDKPARIGGSSPLARGLHPDSGGGHRWNRIIPARAGFTLGARPPGPGSRDHPRSRGVYTRDFFMVADTLRIIPARAGFTARWGSGARRREDHPRSRGVYYSWRRHARRVRGSSPLARGLPRSRVCGA